MDAVLLYYAVYLCRHGCCTAILCSEFMLSWMLYCYTMQCFYAVMDAVLQYYAVTLCRHGCYTAILCSVFMPSWMLHCYTMQCIHAVMDAILLHYAVYLCRHGCCIGTSKCIYTAKDVILLHRSVLTLSWMLYWYIVVYLFYHGCHGVVPKGLLTLLGSLYKEVAKTTSGTLVYRFERQTARKKFFLRKTLCPRLRM